MKAEILDDLCSFQNQVLRPGGKPKDLALRDAALGVKALHDDSRKIIKANIRQLKFIGQGLGNSSGGLDHAYMKSVEIAELAPFLQMQHVAAVAQSMCELIFRMMADNRACSESFNVHVQAMKLAFSEDSTNCEPDSSTSQMISGLGLVVGMLPDPDAELKVAAAG